jgi:hypothetical protein
MDTEQAKYHRKGRIQREEDGTLVLINEENQGYIVDEAVAYVWAECDGKSEDELVDTFSQGVDVDREDLRKDIRVIISKLKEVNLVE